MSHSFCGVQSSSSGKSVHEEKSAVMDEIERLEYELQNMEDEAYLFDRDYDYEDMLEESRIKTRLEELRKL